MKAVRKRFNLEDLSEADMKFINKVLLGAGVLLASAAAQAAILPVSFYTPGGGTLIAANVDELDWSTAGAAVVIGAGPFGTPLSVGTVFENRLQTSLAGFLRNGAPIGSSQVLAGLNDDFGTVAGAYEITAVARFTEVTVTASPNTATFTILGGFIDIYYDSAAGGGSQANLAAGTGYDDGSLIYRGVITSGSSGFGVSPLNPNTGTGSTNINSLTAILDSTAIQGLPSDLLSFFLNSQGEAAYPPGTASTNNFQIGGEGTIYTDYVVGANDLQLRFDGSSRFVPEPGSIALLGLAVLGAGVASARRGKKA